MYQFASNSKSFNRSNSRQYPVIQTKLKIGETGDKYEQEADAVAGTVMQMGEGESLRMQTEEDDEKIQMHSLEEEDKLQMQSEKEEEEEPIQSKSADSSQTKTASENLHSQIEKTKGTGTQIDEQTRTFMGNRFGTDFSSINVHTGQAAEEMNKQLHAQAFTVGNDIYFNSGKYNPNSQEGRKLLAHELTHTIQQGAGIQPMIQKDGEEGTDTSGGSSHPMADLVAGILRDQLSNSNMRGHLSSLGTALQGLAVESTTEGGDQPAAGAERLASLGISNAFETTSGAILRDPGFAALRQRIIDIVGSSDEAALIAVLAAGLAAVLADVKVKGSPSHDIGAGFSVGGSFDFGTIQSLQFNNLQLYAQYASDYFRTRLTGSVSRDAETEEFTGSGTGEVRIGSDISHLLGRVTINSDGEVVLFGRFSGGVGFGGSDRLVFTTDLTHTFATGETIIQPGVSGRFSLGDEQSIRIGSSLSISTDSGLTGVTGFIEYNADFLRLRIEGSMAGIPEERGLAPGGDMRVQGMMIVPLF
jgi:hypothetical protein